MYVFTLVYIQCTFFGRLGLSIKDIYKLGNLTKFDDSQEVAWLKHESQITFETIYKS